MTSPTLAPGMTLLLSWGGVYALLSWWNRSEFGAISWRKVWLPLVTMGLAFGLAQVFQGAAYYWQDAAAVASLKRLDAPFTVLWAWIFFRDTEAENGSFCFRITGSMIVFVGALLIGLGK